MEALDSLVKTDRGHHVCMSGGGWEWARWGVVWMWVWQGHGPALEEATGELKYSREICLNLTWLAQSFPSWNAHKVQVDTGHTSQGPERL